MSGPTGVFTCVIKLSFRASSRTAISCSPHISVITLLCPIAAPWAHCTVMWPWIVSGYYCREDGATHREDIQYRIIITQIKITLFFWHLSQVTQQIRTKQNTLLMGLKMSVKQMIVNGILEHSHLLIRTTGKHKKAAYEEPKNENLDLSVSMWFCVTSYNCRSKATKRKTRERECVDNRAKWQTVIT